VASSTRTEDARYPIQAVAARTGLAPPLLRAWERRYSAVEPERSPAGERLYTDRQIRRLHLLRMLTQNGHRISRIARLPAAELERLLLDVGITPFELPVGAKDTDLEYVLFGRGLAALNALDAAMLEEELERARTVLSPLALADGVICPLLRRADEIKSPGPVVRAARDGMVNLLSDMARELARSVAPLGSGRSILIWNLGQPRDASLPLAAATASLEGMRVQVIHEDATVQEIASFVRLEGPGDLVISIPCHIDGEVACQRVAELREVLDPQTSVFCVAPLPKLFEQVEEVNGVETCATFRELAELIDTNRS